MNISKPCKKCLVSMICRKDCNILNQYYDARSLIIFSIQALVFHSTFLISWILRDFQFAFIMLIPVSVITYIIIMILDTSKKFPMYYTQNDTFDAFVFLIIFPVIIIIAPFKYLIEKLND